MSCDKSQLGISLLLEIATDRSSNMGDKPRPYLTAALLCEKVLVETDGSVSAIRIADRVQLQMQGPPGIGLAGIAMPPSGGDPVAIFNISCLVALKSGPAVGDYMLRLKFITPSGKEQGTPIEQPVTLRGQDQGQNCIIQIYIAAQEEGLYWIHVMLDDMELTRIPLIVART
jgi:hypothetical protein